MSHGGRCLTYITKYVSMLLERKDIVKPRKNEQIFIPKDIYGKILDLVPISTADFVLTRTNHQGQKEFALGRRLEPPWAGNYAVPGGRIIWGESPDEAVARHLKREFGIDVREDNAVPRFVGCLSVMNPSSKHGGQWHSIWHLYEVQVGQNTKIIPNRENTKVSWFTEINRRWPAPIRRGIRMLGFV
jgi:ADP-ribose pyrophosphatase YjhB (NUDIX family)